MLYQTSERGNVISAMLRLYIPLSSFSEPLPTQLYINLSSSGTSDHATEPLPSHLPRSDVRCEH